MTTEIDPYEAIVLVARANSSLSTLLGTQIDIWHRYGQDSGDWVLGSQSLIFVPSGGDAERDVNVSNPILNARCYGDTPFECGQVWKALNDFVFNQPKRTVVTSNGKALVYYVLPVEGGGMPTLLFDEDIRPNGGMPFYEVALQASVSNLIVT